MIDCSATEIRAIKEVFGENDIDILLCHWHIKRAWETHIKKDVKISNSTHETKRPSKTVFVLVYAGLNNIMMNANSEETFNLSLQLFHHQFKDQTVFIAYFDKLWVPKKELWSRAWRQHATFHTNNLIESYHNQLKSFYIGRSRQLRVDYIIWKQALSVLRTVQLGHASDPPGVQLYFASGIKDKYGLTLYRCIRGGTNSLEGGLHQNLIRKFGSFGAGPELANAMLTEYRLRHNLDVGTFNRLIN